MIEHYFATARERYRILRERRAGAPAPWTTDPVFKEWRFCNVHRENDKTTAWFRTHVRNPLPDLLSEDPNVHPETDGLLRMVMATVAFRWFNRIETGERIKDLLLNGWDSTVARKRLRGVSPVVTGAYIIKGRDGMPKLDGVLACIDDAQRMLPSMIRGWGDSLHGAWKDLQDIPYLGRFMAYEIVSDLRWTPVLDMADDIHTWANAGPGCARGLGRIFYQDKWKFNRNSRVDQIVMLELMREILECSKDPQYWPQNWQPWEMREVEHWACEFDKYCRVAHDGERMKQRYHS